MRSRSAIAALGRVGALVAVACAVVGWSDAASAETADACATKAGVDHPTDLPPIPNDLGFRAGADVFERLGVRPDDLVRALPAELLDVAVAPDRPAPDQLLARVDAEKVVARLAPAQIVAAAERIGEVRPSEELLGVLMAEGSDVVAGLAPERIAEILDVDVSHVSVDAGGAVVVDDGSSEDDGAPPDSLDADQVAEILEALTQSELGWAVHRGREEGAERPRAPDVLAGLGIVPRGRSVEEVIVQQLPAAQITEALGLSNRALVELLGDEPSAFEDRLVDAISAEELAQGLGVLPEDVSDLAGRPNAEILDQLGAGTRALLEGVPPHVVLRVLLDDADGSDESEHDSTALSERLGDFDVDAAADRLFSDPTLVRLLGANVVLRADLQLVDVVSLSASEHRFDIVADFAAVWCDPRRIDLGGYDETDDATWVPSIRIPDAVQPRETLRSVITDDGTGTVRYEERFRAEVVWTGSIRLFPFDRHSIELRVVPDTNQILVRDVDLLEDGPDLAAGRSPNDWNWNSEAVRLEAALGGDLVVMAEVDRAQVGYMINVMLPMVLIVIVSWLVFWMKPKALNERTAILVTMFLALVAFDFFSNTAVPAVPYTTFLDGAVLTSYGFVLVALLGTVSIHALKGSPHGAPRPRIAVFGPDCDTVDRRFQRWFMWCYGAALVGVWLGFVVAF